MDQKSGRPGQAEASFRRKKKGTNKSIKGKNFGTQLKRVSRRLRVWQTTKVGAGMA